MTWLVGLTTEHSYEVRLVFDQDVDDRAQPAYVSLNRGSAQ